jgi:hypothetical protein
MKTSKLSQHQNNFTTINTLREHANEMLQVANYLEATQKFIGNGITPTVHARSPGKRMSLVTRRKIGKANSARAARRKDLSVVGKTAA